MSSNNYKKNNMRGLSIFLLTFLLIIFNSFSQENWEFFCDNSTMVSVPVSDVNNDGVIDNECDYFSAYVLACPDSELVFYLLEDLEGLGCDFDFDEIIEINDDLGDDEDEDNDWEDEDNDWGDVFTFECNGEEITIELDSIGFIDYESYIESILSNYDCEEWSDDEDNDWDWDDEDNDWDWEDEDNNWNWNDIDWIVSDWENFDWEDNWSDLNLDNIDWSDIPWDGIINFDINPNDLINYILDIIMSSGQPFNWDDFINHYTSLMTQDIFNNPYLLKSIDMSGKGINSNHQQSILINIYSNGVVEKIYIIR